MTRKYKAQFYMFVIQSLSQMGMTAEQQRFYWTIYLQGKGLSSNGCIVVSRLGIALPYSTFKLRIGEWIEAQNRHLRCKKKALM